MESIQQLVDKICEVCSTLTREEVHSTVEDLFEEPGCDWDDEGRWLAWDYVRNYVDNQDEDVLAELMQEIQGEVENIGAELDTNS